MRFVSAFRSFKLEGVLTREVLKAKKRKISVVRFSEIDFTAVLVLFNYFLGGIK